MFIYLNFSGYKRIHGFSIKILEFLPIYGYDLTSWTGMKSDGSNNLRQTKGNGVSCLYMKFYKTAGSFFFKVGTFVRVYSIVVLCVLYQFFQNSC